MMTDKEYERKKKELELQEQISESIKDSTSSLNDFADAQKTIAKNYKVMREITQEIENNEKKIQDILKKNGGIVTKEVEDLREVNDQARQQYALYQGINKELSKKRNLLKAAGNELINGAKTLAGKFIPSLNEIFDKFMSIDHLAHQTANTLGFQGDKFKMMADNLSITRDEFVNMGFSIESAYAAQTALSDATGRQVMLTKEASTAIAETARITGMEVEALAGLTGEMEAFGLGAKQSSDFISQMSQETSAMGLNSGKVIKKFQENLGLLNKLNFKNGVRGLKEMAKFSEKFKIDMQDVASVADKVFRPEGAIEAAAQLQVLGGSLAALGDPFQLMYKARNAPEELAKSLTKAASASATFNKKTGEFEVNANELDRLREAASALGMDYSKLVETAKQGAKIGKFEGILGGKGFDKETIDALTGAAQMGEKGAFITVNGNEKLLKDLNESEAKAFVAQKKSQSELAQQAMSVQSSFDSIKNGIMVALVKVFEGVDWTSIMNSLKEVGKWVIGAINWFREAFSPTGLLITGLGIYFGGKAIWAMVQGLLLGKTAGSVAGGIIAADMTAAGTVVASEIAAAQAGGGAAGAVSGVAGTAGKVVSQGGAVSGAAGGGIGGSLTSLAGGLSAMGTPQVLFGALNLIPTALGMLTMIAAIPTLLVLGLVPLAQLGTNLTNIAIGLEFMGNPVVSAGAANLLLASLAFVAMTAGILGLTAIALGGVAAGVGLEGLSVGLTSLGATFPVAILGIGLLDGLALAMLGFGASILMVGMGISLIVLSFSQLFESIGPNGSSLLLAGLGFMAMATGIGVLTMSLIALGAASLLALPGLAIFGMAASMLSETASSISSSGGADSISGMVTTINSLDTGKLEALKDLSMWLALVGTSPTIKFDENLKVDGNIQISGQAGGKTNTDWINDSMFIAALKEKIMKSADNERKSPGRNNN
jgi:hypothetical protein